MEYKLVYEYPLKISDKPPIIIQNAEHIMQESGDDNLQFAVEEPTPIPSPGQETASLSTPCAAPPEERSTRKGKEGKKNGDRRAEKSDSRRGICRLQRDMEPGTRGHIPCITQG